MKDYSHPGRLLGAKLSLLAFSLLPGTSAACRVDGVQDDSVRQFQEANETYSEGKIDQALHQYLGLVEQGFSSGPLLYNIGNCYYRRGETGRAILFFERARRLIPGDDDLLHNLALSRLNVVDKITPMPEFWLLRIWKGLILLLPHKLLSTILTVSWLGFVASLILWLLGSSAWGRRAVPAAGLLLVILVLSMILLGGQWWYRSGTTEAVVLAESVRAFGSPGGGVEVFVLHEGVKVRIDEIRDEWYEIVLADGNHGWVRGDDLEVI